ncbi:TetR family transcriptional regulator [Mycobacterium sp. H4Y]|nr:TetR family transcriptional regulator [Mycobacterium sp. H4Y]
MREQVLRATRELTIEKGWEQVRVSEVAELRYLESSSKRGY